MDKCHEKIMGSKTELDDLPKCINKEFCNSDLLVEDVEFNML